MIEETAHRPRPLPAARPAMTMSWHELLFLHWPVHPHLLRPLIPAALEVDTFDGLAWIGVVPFRMSGVRPRYAPAPLHLAFLKSTSHYVKAGDRSGSWFQPGRDEPARGPGGESVVRVAVLRRPHPVEQVVREHPLPQQARHRGRRPRSSRESYRPGPVYGPSAARLEHWLTERYCLFAADRRGRVGFGDIHHAPWPLQPAEADIECNTMTEWLGIALPATNPVIHFARRLDVVAWSVVRLGAENDGSIATIEGRLQ